MTASKNHAILVYTETVRDERGVYVATSPTLKGFLAVSEDLEKLHNEIIPRAIADLYEACGVKMLVNRIRNDQIDEACAPWVALPAKLVQQQLEEAV